MKEISPLVAYDKEHITDFAERCIDEIENDEVYMSVTFNTVNIVIHGGSHVDDIVTIYNLIRELRIMASRHGEEYPRG